MSLSVTPRGDAVNLLLEGMLTESLSCVWLGVTALTLVKCEDVGGDRVIIKGALAVAVGNTILKRMIIITKAKGKRERGKEEEREKEERKYRKGK